MRRREGKSTGEHASKPGAAEDTKESTGSLVLPDSLVRVLASPDIVKAGAGIRGDVSKLQKEFQQLREQGLHGVVELSELAKRKVP